jgi:hypothetical protein
VPESCAPTLLGPIEARADNPEFTGQLRPFPTLNCHVVTATGKPARRFAIGAEPRTTRAIAPPIASRTDDDGIARFTKCTPGIHEIAVWENRSKLATVEVDLLPGVNPDIVLHLPN